MLSGRTGRRLEAPPRYLFFYPLHNVARLWLTPWPTCSGSHYGGPFLSGPGRRRSCSVRPSLTGVFRARCGLPLPIARCWRCRRCAGPPSSSAPLGVPLAPPSYSFLLRFRAPAVSPPLLSPLRVSGRAAGRPQSSRGLVGVLVFAAFVACASWCSRFQSASTVSQLLGFV